jgi:hypothetical protein
MLVRVGVYCVLWNLEGGGCSARGRHLKRIRGLRVIVVHVRWIEVGGCSKMVFYTFKIA